MFHLIILPVIVWQSLFLLIATTWDSFLFYRQLRVGRIVAIEYARNLNLFTLVIGWIIFFLVTPFLSPTIELELTSVLFFNQTFEIKSGEVEANSIIVFLVIIGTTTVIKFAGMRILQKLLGNFSPAVDNINHHKLTRKPLFTFTSELSIIFLSNILINISIFLLIFIKFLYSIGK
jgi:hypothetical protein